MIRLSVLTISSVLLGLLLVCPLANAADNGVIEPSAYQDLRYRLVGPFRASRTVGGVGVPTQPNVFYIGADHADENDLRVPGQYVRVDTHRPVLERR